MNAEDFYEQFKQALKLMGVRWGEKELVRVKGEITLELTSDNKRIVYTLTVSEQ